MLENDEKIIKNSEKINFQSSQHEQQQNLNNKHPNQSNSTSLSSQEEETNNKNEFNNGRWSDEEHKKFIEGILEHGNEWKKVQKIIKTRSSTQARSHAQKFFLRIKKSLCEFNSKKNNIVDNNEMIKYIIETYNNNKKKENNLTNEQKEKLINVINSKYNNNTNNNNNNLKKHLNNNIIINKNNLINDNNNSINEKNNKIIINENNGNKIQLKIEIESNEMDDNLSYKKKKNSKTPSNKIFQISKDYSHRYSMEIPINNNNNLNDNISLIPSNNTLQENNFSFKDINEEENYKNNEKMNNPFNIQFNFSKDEEILHNIKSHFDINEKEQHLLNNYIKNYHSDNDLMQIDDDCFLNCNNQNNN